jgi:magnesium transporter
MTRSKRISNNIDELTLNNTRQQGRKVTWVNINNAGHNEIEYLRKKYGFSLTHLQASLARYVSQRPIIEREEDIRIKNERGYLFLILHFPIFKDGQLMAAEIDFFVGHGFLVTAHNNNEIVNNFFNLAKKDGDSTLTYKLESSAILLYEILKKLTSGCFPLLDQNSVEIGKIEEVIFNEEGEKTAVSNILLLRRNIINFRKIMQNHKNIIKKLQEIKSTIVSRDNIKKCFKDLTEHTERIWEILEGQKEMIEIFYDTNESLMGYRLNDIMKTLTIFSVIMFPLTLFAAVFGMNAVNGMPFLNAPYGFWYVILIMFLGCLGMLFFFEKKKWL